MQSLPQGQTFVAEFTTNHMGNLNVLMCMVERAAWAGADFIKMQKKDVETFYSKEKLDAPFLSAYGKTYRDYRRVFEFDDDDFKRFDAKCKAHNIRWFSTVQDLPSLHFMLKYDLPAYKVASSNARNHALLSAIQQNIPRDKTLVISVAGCSLDEIETSLNQFPHHKIWLLHCVAQYPCPHERLRLGNIAILRKHFADDRITIGYSGHEEGIAPSLAAIDLGAEVVERHFCLSRHSFVHHIECSLEPGELRELVGRVREGRRVGEGCAGLPREALTAAFGMSDREKKFLVEQTYGTKFVGDASAFGANDVTPAVGHLASTGGLGSNKKPMAA